MRILINIFKAELIKIKLSSAFLLTVILPLVCVLLYFLIFYINGDYFITKNISPWLLYISYTIGFWTLFIMPLYVTLLTSLINEIESKSNSWKQILSIGISKHKIFLGKFLIIIFSFILSLQFIFFLILLSGKLLAVLRPEFEFDKYSIPYFELIIVDIHIIISSVLIIIIHYFLSVFVNRIFFSLSLGLVLTILNVVITNSDFAFLFPWSYPSLIVGNVLVKQNYLPTNYEIFSLIGSVILLFLSVYYFARKRYL